MCMTYIAATGNMHKLTEFKRILTPLNIKLISTKEANVYVNVEETAKTFEGNAEIKALAICKAADMPAIADDSGIVVDALGGAPGIYSSRYAGPNSTDLDKMNKLLNEIKDVPKEKRTARFVCAICCIFPNGKTIQVRGTCEGYIADEICGNGGFGYDPIFIEKETGKTFGILSDDEKDRLSHRGKALRLFAEKLKEALCKETEN